MPAPSSQMFREALKNAYISNGLVDKIIDPLTKKLVNRTPAQIPPAAQKQINAIADAMAQVFITWQAAQVVEIPITSAPGSPSFGRLP